MHVFVQLLMLLCGPYIEKDLASRPVQYLWHNAFVQGYGDKGNLCMTFRVQL